MVKGREKNYFSKIKFDRGNASLIESEADQLETRKSDEFQMQLANVSSHLLKVGEIYGGLQNNVHLLNRRSYSSILESLDIEVSEDAGVVKDRALIEVFGIARRLRSEIEGLLEKTSENKKLEVYLKEQLSVAYKTAERCIDVLTPLFIARID